MNCQSSHFSTCVCIKPRHFNVHILYTLLLLLSLLLKKRNDSSPHKVHIKNSLEWVDIILYEILIEFLRVAYDVHTLWNSKKCMLLIQLQCLSGKNFHLNLFKTDTTISSWQVSKMVGNLLKSIMQIHCWFYEPKIGQVASEHWSRRQFSLFFFFTNMFVIVKEDSLCEFTMIPN